MLRTLIDNIMKKKNYNYNYIYDWTTLEEKESRKNNRTKTEPTNGDTMIYNENEKSIYYNEQVLNDNIYHIQRNCKFYENRFDKKETPVCCTTTCSIF